MKVEVFELLLQHAVLLPHIILSVAQEEELRDAEVAENAPLVSSGIVHRLAPVIPQVQRSKVAQTAHELLYEAQEGPLCRCASHGLVVHSCAAYLPIFGILQRAQTVHAVQLHLVEAVVERLGEGHRLHEACEDAHVITQHLHIGVTAGRGEELLVVVLGEQPDRAGVAKQHIKGVVRLARNLHGVLALKPQAAHAVAYLPALQHGVPGHDVDGDRLLPWSCITSEYPH